MEVCSFFTHVPPVNSKSFGRFVWFGENRNTLPRPPSLCQPKTRVEKCYFDCSLTPTQANASGMIAVAESPSSPGGADGRHVGDTRFRRDGHAGGTPGATHPPNPPPACGGTEDARRAAACAPNPRVRGGGLGGCAGPRLQDSDDGRHRRRRAMK